MKLSKIEIHAVDHCTQKCQHCSHAADIAKPASYGPSDYEPWLKLLKDRGIQFKLIEILGGEPFLLDVEVFRDLVLMAKRYGNWVNVMSNMFWLEDIDKYDRVLQEMMVLSYTLYPSYVQQQGGIERVREMLHDLDQRYPNLCLQNWHTNKIDRANSVCEFASIEFHDEPRPAPFAKDCKMKGCKQLLSTGKLLGCCVALRTEKHGRLDEFDLNGDWTNQEFIDWYNQEELKLCKHCSIGSDGPNFVLWQLTPRRKDD